MKSQLQLRRGSLGIIGPRVYGDRGFLVCGVVLSDRSEWASRRERPPERVNLVAEVGRVHEHPLADEFRRYLAWRQSLLESPAGGAD